MGIEGELMCKFFNKTSLIWHMILAIVLCLFIESCSRHSVKAAFSFMKETPFIFLYNSLIIFVTLLVVYLFKKLISVNGIGPKVAQGILASMDADSLKFAIMAGDAKLIAKTPGVGPKSAERIILDLRDKISIDLDSVAIPNADIVTDKKQTDIIKTEAVEALVALGYSSFEAAKAVSQVERTDKDSVESVLKAAFKYLY